MSESLVSPKDSPASGSSFLRLWFLVQVAGIPLCVGLALIVVAIGHALIVQRPLREAVALAQNAAPEVQHQDDREADAGSDVESVPINAADIIWSLPSAAELNDELRQVFSAADMHGISIAQAEYQGQASSSGSGSRPAWPVAEMRIEAVAQYVPMRRFINQVILSQPGMALSQLSISRDSVEQASVRWRLTLSIYMRPPQ